MRIVVNDIAASKGGAMTVLKDIEGISITTLTTKDVVRHPLVQRIIVAYERYEKKKEAQKRGDE